MASSGNPLNPRRLAGFAAWLAAGLPIAIFALSGQASRPPFPLALGAVAYAAFGLAFEAFSRARENSLGRPAHVFLLGVQSLASLVIAAIFHTGFEGILPVVVAAQLIFVLPLRAAAIWVLVQTIVYAALVAGHSSPLVALVVALAYLSFQAFAVYTGWIAEKEAAQRAELALVNAELGATQELLAQSSRLAERARISRDLHDILGHHLTALSLNLEVASHLTSGDGREAVEKARSVAKLLLADVRGVVSQFREDDAIDLRPALEALARGIPRPRVEIDVDPGVRISDPATAETILRCIQETVTNAARHSGAHRLTVSVASRDGALVVDARDDGAGCGPSTPHEGHGLTGMRERVAALGGTLRIETAAGRGFGVSIRLPRNEVPS